TCAKFAVAFSLGSRSPSTSGFGRNGERFKQSPWRPPSPSGPQSRRNCKEVRFFQSSEILLELVFSDVSSFDHVCTKLLEICPHKRGARRLALPHKHAGLCAGCD